MIVEISSKGEITLPEHVLEAMGFGPGDRLETHESADGFVLRPQRIDLSLLGGLRDKIKPGTPPFDIRKFRDDRERGRGPSVRHYQR